MRSYDEISRDMSNAFAAFNHTLLPPLVQEMIELGTPKAMAMAYNAQGAIEMNAGHLDEAVALYERAIEKYNEIPDRLGAAHVISNIGNVYRTRGELKRALEQYRHALSEHQAVNDRLGIGRALSSIGIIHADMGDYNEALSHYDQSRLIYEEIGNRAGAAGVDIFTGAAYTTIGDYPRALECFGRALAISEELNSPPGIGRALANMGVVYNNTGEYPKAMEVFQRSLTICEEVGEPYATANCLGNLGSVNSTLGNQQLAFDLYTRAMSLYDATDNRVGSADMIRNIGKIYSERGEHERALQEYHRAMEVYRDTGDRSEEALTLGWMVNTLCDLQRFDEAAELSEVQGAMEIADPVVRAFHYSNRSLIARQNADLDAAHAHLLTALQIVHDVGARSDEASYHEELRDLAQLRNDFAGYVHHNAEFLRLREEVHGKEATQRLAMLDAERKIEEERRGREKERALLYGALPKSVADRMIRGEKVTGDHYDNASVLFLDIVGFTRISDRIPPGHVVHLLEQIFTTLDAVCERHGVMKIKTIGDSYMAVAFSNTEDQTPKTGHVVSAALCAVEMLAALNTLEVTMPPDLGDTSWTSTIDDIAVRIGLHCGPVTAGVIGTQRLQYDVWGDTVNVASRMESHGEPGRIHVSESFASALRLNDSMTSDAMTLLERGQVLIKGKGEMTTFWLE